MDQNRIGTSTLRGANATDKRGQKGSRRRAKRKREESFEKSWNTFLMFQGGPSRGDSGLFGFNKAIKRTVVTSGTTV